MRSPTAIIRRSHQTTKGSRPTVGRSGPMVRRRNPRKKRRTASRRGVRTRVPTAPRPGRDLMWRHVAEQMKNVLGGLGEKMEDWVERQHQDGKRSRDAYRRVANVQARADARAHKGHRRCRADIRAQVELVKSDASRNLKRVKDESAEMKRRKERPWNSSSVQ